uniref:Secreted protein n=1 Tax=Romanomermis culicivorax TaxID=13658 RepID=A0A915HKI9_ROMCU
MQLLGALCTHLSWTIVIITVSKPSKTKSGIVVKPPRFHSSKDTVPSESKSISLSMSRRPASRSDR